MDLLKTQLERIQQQLGGLSASQKMLTASLVAIMVMTLFWWGRYAGTSEMSPVFEQALSAEQVAQIRNSLVANQIDARVDAGRVLVPTDRRDEAIAVLAMAEVLPEDTASTFDEMAKQMNPFLPTSQQEALLRGAKQRRLGQIIGRFKGVRSAEVLITPSTGRRIGGGFEASAGVTIFTKAGATIDRKLVNGAAQLVASAEPGLLPTKVRVVVDGVPQMVTDPTDVGLTDDLDALIVRHEQRFREKILNTLPHFQNALVTVTVKINTVTSQEQSREFGPNIQSKEIETESSNTETIGEPPAAAEPGVIANGAATTLADNGMIAAPTVGGSTSTTSEERSRFAHYADEKVTTSTKPAGEPTVVSAAVRLPRSHFVNIAKRKLGSDKEPDDAQLAAIVQPEIEHVQKVAQAACGLADPTPITVSIYEDDFTLMAAAAAAVPVDSPVTATLGGHAKEIAVGALAVVSLFMLTLMVRKGSATPALVAAASEPAAPQTLDTNSDLAGVVGDGDPMLDAMELDDDAVKAQHMIGQVQQMVKDNPDAAATLVKRWMNRS